MEFSEAVQGKPSEKKSDFPYEAYRKSQLWRTVEKSIEELAENQDINLTTKKDYVVGYICKKIHQEFEWIAKKKT